MMSCSQANIFCPNVKVGLPHRPSSRSSHLNPSFLNVSHSFPRLVYSPSKNRKFDPLCLAKGDSKSGSEDFSWDSLKKAMGGMKQEPSVQDWLKDQMSKQELGGNGGGGGRTGGGGDGSSGESGEEEGGFAAILDEFLQVILATIGFIFVYVYLIRGAELTRLARDYVKYLFGASPSVRLSKAMRKWGRFYQKLKRKEYKREDWLERAIVATPTWWHKPEIIARLAEYRMGSNEED